MKSRMNKLMSLCLVAMMGTTFIPQPIQAEEVGEFEEESFEEATVEFEEATFEEEKQNVEASPENSVTADFEYRGLKYKVTDENKKEVEVIGFADGYQPTRYELRIPDTVSKQDGLYKKYTVTSIGKSAFAGCIGIREIYLPEGLKTIGDSAFELGESTTAEDSPHLEFINIPSSVETLGKIFGDKNPFGSEYKEELVLTFSRETLPKGIENLLDVISKGNNKPTIYFPNTETALNTYAGKESPFVIKGLINRDYFDSSIEQEYESVQMCPGGEEVITPTSIRYSEITLKFTSSNPEVASAKQAPASNAGKVTAKSPGETIISCFTQFQGKELISDHNKVKVKVDHKYSWQIEKLPTADQPGSMFQYCLRCGYTKESVPIPPTGGGSTGGSTSGGSGGSGGGSSTDSNAPTQQVENAVYRAYNPYNGEHLYTTNYQEFKVITKNGWDDEGIAFMSESKEKGQAAYRVYNPNSGLHHYTTNVNEKNALVSLGWNDEGVAFYTSKNPKDTPVYRVYNENDGNHHYTMNANEALALISMGWKNEGIAFLTAPMK